MEHAKTGDLVQLKSGGPVMTVVGKQMNSSRLICMWFVNTSEFPQTLREGSFSPEALKVVEE